MVAVCCPAVFSLPKLKEWIVVVQIHNLLLAWEPFRLETSLGGNQRSFCLAVGKLRQKTPTSRHATAREWVRMGSRRVDLGVSPASRCWLVPLADPRPGCLAGEQNPSCLCAGSAVWAEQCYTERLLQGQQREGLDPIRSPRVIRCRGLMRSFTSITESLDLSCIIWWVIGGLTCFKNSITSSVRQLIPVVRH